jgi:hypothetical protein
MSGSIKGNSYVTDVIAANDIVKAKADDLEGWSKVNMGSFLQKMWSEDDMKANSKAGLFQFDMSTFLADCKISLYCNDEVYSKQFDGLAMGQTWYIDPKASLKASGAQWIKADYQIYTCF